MTDWINIKGTFSGWICFSTMRTFEMFVGLKLYDTVDHCILVDKMEKYGIRWPGYSYLEIGFKPFLGIGGFHLWFEYLWDSWINRSSERVSDPSSGLIMSSLTFRKKILNVIQTWRYQIWHLKKNRKTFASVTRNDFPLSFRFYSQHKLEHRSFRLFFHGSEYDVRNDQNLLSSQSHHRHLLMKSDIAFFFFFTYFFVLEVSPNTG